MMGLVGVVAAGCSSASAPEPIGDPQVLAGGEVFGQSCEVCHGRRGSGKTAPALNVNLLADFPNCLDHLRWVTLGTARWKEEVGNDVGSSGREISGVMPGFGESLTPLQIRDVVLYERVALAGADLATEQAACGAAG